MRATITLLTFMGAILGALPLVLMYVELQSAGSDVTYSGSYGPLRGVEMTQAYETALNLSFEARSQGLLTTTRLVLYPAIGALTGLVIGATLAQFGRKLTRA